MSSVLGKRVQGGRLRTGAGRFGCFDAGASFTKQPAFFRLGLSTLIFGAEVAVLMKSNNAKGFLVPDKLSFSNNCQNKGSTASTSEPVASIPLVLGKIPTCTTVIGAAQKQ